MKLFEANSSPENIAFLFDRTVKKILSFLDLPNGWHFGKGGPIAMSIVGQALKINDNAQFAGLHTDAFPGYNGEIQINCYQNDKTFEFTIENLNDIKYLVEQDGREISCEEHLSLQEAINKIINIRKTICDISDSFIPTIMKETERDSVIWRLRTPQTEAAYQLYPLTV